MSVSRVEERDAPMQRARQWLTFFTLGIALAAVATPAWGQQGGMSGLGSKTGMRTKRPPASSPGGMAGMGSPRSGSGMPGGGGMTGMGGQAGLGISGIRKPGTLGIGGMSQSSGQTGMSDTSGSPGMPGKQDGMSGAGRGPSGMGCRPSAMSRGGGMSSMNVRPGLGGMSGAGGQPGSSGMVGSPGMQGKQDGMSGIGGRK